MTDKTRQDSGSTHIIRYALELGLLWIDGDGRDKVREALDALNSLEAQLEAVGAGGLQALSAAPAEQQVASSAVLKAIREANMQLVRTGDDEFMLVPCKVATTGAALGVAPGVTYANKPDAVAWLAEYGGGVFTSAQLLEFADRTHALRMEQAAPKAAPGEQLTREQIREVFMAHGFTIKEGQTDLKQYVYDAAYALLGLVAAPQQEAQPNYVVSLVVLKGIPTGFNTQNKLYAVNAVSSDEAVSKAVLQMPNDFPEHRLHTACFVAIPAQPAPAPLSEREAFEAWIEKDGGDLGTFGTPPNMHYRNSSVNNAWVAWKARAALAAQGGK